MFNLETAIVEWRRQMLAAGIKAPVPLEELENHLREDFEERVRSGQAGEPAFALAASQISQAKTLQIEFARVGGTVFERLLQFFHKFAGIPDYQPATNMNNTNSNLEPRWATYAKAGAFIFPATFLWLFTAVFVLPKANQICHEAGTTVFNFANAPAIFRGSAVNGQGVVFLSSHVLLTSAAFILAIMLLERYFQPWARYRRLAINAGVYLLNAVVLLTLTLIIISIVVAAPFVAHHGY